MKRAIFVLFIIVLCIQYLGAQVNFEHEFSFSYPANAENVEIKQLYDYNNDNIDDVVLEYTNGQTGDKHVLIYESNGTVLDSLTFQPNDTYPQIFDFYIFRRNNYNHIISSFYDDNYNLLTKIRNLQDSSIVDSAIYNPDGLLGDFRVHGKFDHDDISTFTVGYTITYMETSYSHTLKFDLVNDSLSFIDCYWDGGLSSVQVNDSTILYVSCSSSFNYPSSSTTYYILDKFTNYNSFELVDFVVGYIIYGDPKNKYPIYDNFPLSYKILSKNDLAMGQPHLVRFRILDTEEGYSVGFRAFDSINWQEIWSSTYSNIGTGGMQAATCIEVNDENNYVLYFCGDKLEIRNRTDGTIKHYQDSVITCLKILRESNDNLLFFVNDSTRNEYDVYTNDPIYIAIDDPAPANEFELHAYPNPFHKSTTFSYSGQSNLTNEPVIKIFNLKGQLIKQLPLVTQSQSPKVSVTWDGTDNLGHSVSSGLYFYQFKSGKEVIAENRCLLLR